MKIQLSQFEAPKVAPIEKVVMASCHPSGCVGPFFAPRAPLASLAEVRALQPPSVCEDVESDLAEYKMPEKKVGVVKHHRRLQKLLQ